ncbi:hypothetical protein [Streptomyces sp. NBC_01451]|uniref:hypothetical protein n=1 Tax=Streptomyces sp. NBC_01451 TaxID=2903872 RepID=UPI002E30BC8B|nr:hypothetical protein [Streptomyces sp. NBC_01451]
MTVALYVRYGSVPIVTVLPPGSRPVNSHSRPWSAQVSNRSKSDQEPATWQPPAAGYRCAYATDRIAIKTRWRLSADPVE